MPPDPPYRVVLASASPRRRELLTAAGLEFEVALPRADEAPVSGETPRQYVARVAREKALAVARERADAAVVAADTAVVLDGRVYGKPLDDDDAVRMLRSLSGRTHQVITAVCVLSPAGCFETQVETQVRFLVLTEQQIRAYVGSGEPRDKAGAYAIQGQGGSLVEGFTGSRSNVVGLPIDEALDLLRRAGAAGGGAA